MEKTCQICGSHDTEVVSQVETFEYKGQKIAVPEYTKISCHNCGESVPVEDAVKRSVSILRDVQRTIDGLLTGSEIKAIRKSFGKTQEEFSDILGGGKKAFARYETGKIAQSKPMDKLLRILKVLPEAMNVIDETDDSEACSVTEKVRYSPYINEQPFNYVLHQNTFRKLSA
jgi:HTH-type transcriptional regulator / antitoxin MqsA